RCVCTRSRDAPSVQSEMHSFVSANYCRRAGHESRSPKQAERRLIAGFDEGMNGLRRSASKNLCCPPLEKQTPVSQAAELGREADRDGRLLSFDLVSHVSEGTIAVTYSDIEKRVLVVQLS